MANRKKTLPPGITPRGKDKEGLETWLITNTHNGKRFFHTVHGSTEEAIASQDRKQAELRTCGASANLRFEAFAEQWFKDISKKNAPMTIAWYRGLYDSGIGDFFGKYRLGDIQAPLINKFMRTLVRPQLRDKEKMLSGHSQLKYFRLLAVMLQEAVYLGYIPFNPCKQVRPPKKDPYQARHYSIEELAQLWQALQTEPLIWQAIIGLALCLGIRRGELVGLCWGDIDFEKEIVTIRRAAHGGKKVRQDVGKTKTVTSLRDIPLPEDIVPILKAWQQEQGGGVEDFICAWALANNKRKWISVDTPTHWFKRFLEDHHLPPMHLHGLRHSYVTLNMRAGVPIADIQKLAGHANASTTMIYSHWENGSTDAVKTNVSSVTRFRRDATTVATTVATA